MAQRKNQQPDASSEQQPKREADIFTVARRVYICAGKSQSINVSDIDSDGRFTDASINVKIDAIGWRVPAIPTEDGETYWGYTSVPEAGVAWWRALPTRAA